MRTPALFLSLPVLLAVVACGGRSEAPIAIPVEPPTDATVYEELRLVPIDAVGRFVRGSGVVGEVFSDRGFWIGSGDDRILAVVREDVPRPEMIDIDVGDRLELTAVVWSAERKDELAGTLEADTIAAIDDEGRFLLTHWKWVEIVEEGVDAASVPTRGLSTDDLIDVVYERRVDMRPPAAGFVVVDFSAQDTDNDGHLDLEELSEGLASEDERLFHGMDTSDDLLLSTTEFLNGLVDLLDRDNDGRMTHDAFVATLGTWMDVDRDRWLAWDTSGDEELDELELSLAIGGVTGLFGDWDRDSSGYVDRFEFARGVLQTWDTDADGRVSADEYRDGARPWYSQFEGEYRFTLWDLDRDSALSRAELVSGIVAWHGAWDLDHDGDLAEPELLAGLFTTWDVDTSGAIEPWEYDLAWFHGDSGTDWSTWDVDGDGEISVAEFTVRVPTFSLVPTWDVNDDGHLDATELGTALFDHWDTDEDGDLDLPEYRAY